MTNYYKLRTNLKEISLKNDLDHWFNEHCDSYAWCIEHMDSNVHMHWYLETNKTMPLIRSFLRSLEMKGNRDYSLKTLDSKRPVEYLGYLVKEGNYAFINLPSDLMDEAKAYNAKVVDEMKEKRNKTKNRKDIIMQYLKNELAPHIKYYSDSKNDFFTTPNEHMVEMVGSYIVKYFNDNDIIIRRFYVQNLIDTFLCKNSPQYVRYFLGKMI